MKILIREDQAVKIEEEWAIATGTHEQFLATQRNNEVTRRRLQTEFGREPSENDVRWAKLNEDLIEHAKHFQWGLYRNARLSMGDMLKKEGRFLDALNTYLEVCYLDLNGPNNTGRDAFVLRICPPFDPKNAVLAPAVIGDVMDMLESLELSQDDARERFCNLAEKAQASLKLPVSPEKAWRKLARELH